MNNTPLGELCETSNSTDLSIMWSLMMDRETDGDYSIVRNLLVTARELPQSLNTRQKILNEAKIHKNHKIVKSVAFFRDQQVKELQLMSVLLTDEEIIESVIGINKDDIDEEDDESSTMEPPSRNEAIKAAITLNNFLLSYEKTKQHQKDCMMVVKEIVGRLLKEEEKLEGWFEQDIDKEEERFEGDKDGGEFKAINREVNDTEKEANSKEFPPVGGPIMSGGPIYVWGPPDIYGGRFLEKVKFPVTLGITLDEEETFWEGEEDELE
ncbi:hypothetical protein Tco_0009768 [Tanacetum coccineum]